MKSKKGRSYILSKDLYSYQEKWLVPDKIRHSYSRKGTPYDNAGIESFHASLKKEEVYTITDSDFEEANRALFNFNYVEGFYNRIHSSIDYLTSQEVEGLLKKGK